MKSTRAVVVALTLSAVGSALALDAINDRGTWPKGWPAGLEPLRGRARSVRGGVVDVTRYEIPFADRGEFEAAWPHVLAVKTEGAPVILVRGPDAYPGSKIKGAGVRVHCPPGRSGEPVPPARPIPGQSDPRAAWMGVNFIELFVDGAVVDLNRIPLPPDTPIIDERFDGGRKSPAGRGR